jgi:hypothetical protein
LRIIKSTRRTEVLQLPTNVSRCVVSRRGVVAWGDRRVGWIVGRSRRVGWGVSPQSIFAYIYTVYVCKYLQNTMRNQKRDVSPVHTFLPFSLFHSHDRTLSLSCLLLTGPDKLVFVWGTKSEGQIHQPGPRRPSLEAVWCVCVRARKFKPGGISTSFLTVSPIFWQPLES